MISGDFSMGFFCDIPLVSRTFTFDGDFGLLYMGYQDFSRHYNPEYSSRVQKFYTWHFVISGKGTLKFKGKTYKISAGQTFFLPPNEEICYYPDKDDPWEYVWFAFRGDISENYRQMLGFELPVKNNENFVETEYIIKSTFDELFGGGGYFGVLSSFYKLMELSTTQKATTGIKGVKRLIDESFAQSEFTIEGLARDVGISHPHLLRLFKKEYSITLIKYLTQKRIEYACQLLLSTELSVKSVAFSSGFSDELHFMKTFKKAVGVSALQYRKMCKK